MAAGRIGQYRVSSVDLRGSDIVGPVSELLCTLANLTELESLLLSKNPGLVRTRVVPWIFSHVFRLCWE